MNPLSAYSMMMAARNPWDKTAMESAKAYIEQSNRAQSSDALQQLLAGNQGSIGALDPSLQGVFLKSKMDSINQETETTRKLEVLRSLGLLPPDDGGGTQQAMPSGSPSPVSNPASTRGRDLTALSGVFKELEPVAAMTREEEKWKRENDPENIRAKAAAQEEGKNSGKVEQGKSQVDTLLEEIAGDYMALAQKGQLVSTGKGTTGNILNKTFNWAGGVPGTERSTHLDNIQAAQKTLKTAIKNATGLTGTELNSKYELDALLQSLTDPTKGLETNKATIKRLSDLFGSGTSYFDEGNTDEPKKPAQKSNVINWESLP